MFVRRLVLALGALSVGSVGAIGADLPVKAPPIVPPVVYSWTGIYIGISGGYGWDSWGSRSGIDNTIFSSFCTVGLGGCAAAQFSNAAIAAVPPNFDTSPKGWLAGGQIGYNYQSGQFLWGVEADFSGANISGSDTKALTVVLTGFGANSVTITGSGNQKLDWFGTLRARFGFLPVNPLLLYVTGGLAYGHISADSTFTIAVGGPCFCGPNPTATGSSSSTRVGWTLGSGFEWMFAPHWSFKGEYLYYDLGSIDYPTTIAQLNGAAALFFGVGISSSAHFNGSIARVGLNYKL